MTKPDPGSDYPPKKTRIRTAGAVLAIAMILIGVIAKLSAGPTAREAPVVSERNGVRVAKPEGMKQFPAELIPMP